MGYHVSLLDSSHRTHISERNRRSCLLGSHLMFLAAAFYTGHSFYLCCLAFEILYVLENTSIEETNVNETSTRQLWHAAMRKLKNTDRNQTPLPAHLIIFPLWQLLYTHSHYTDISYPGFRHLLCSFHLPNSVMFSNWSRIYSFVFYSYHWVSTPPKFRISTEEKLIHLPTS